MDRASNTVLNHIVTGVGGDSNAQKQSTKKFDLSMYFAIIKTKKPFDSNKTTFVFVNHINHSLTNDEVIRFHSNMLVRRIKIEYAVHNTKMFIYVLIIFK